MTALKAARKKVGWNQQELATRLGVSQTLVSLWERGVRRFSPRRLRQFRDLGLELPPTTLPLPSHLRRSRVDYGQELANLGYPGFAHLATGEPKYNPALLLVMALAEHHLERRLAEALPWLAFTFRDMNWEWVRREAKLRDLQNRLGFTLALAKNLAAQRQQPEVMAQLGQQEDLLRQSLLAREDTYANETMSEAERKWLTQQRPVEAAAWHVLSDMEAEQLTHA
jgi:transcriptional regulator with XRE-family HTH domain